MYGNDTHGVSQDTSLSDPYWVQAVLRITGSLGIVQVIEIPYVSSNYRAPSFFPRDVPIRDPLARWQENTYCVHRVPPVPVEDACEPEVDCSKVISIRPERPWMLSAQGGPRERRSRRRKIRTWERAA